MKFTSPKLTTGSVVITFQTNIIGVTPKKLYVVEKYTRDTIFIRNDVEQLIELRNIHFMEADVVYSILLLMTLGRLFDTNF